MNIEYLPLLHVQRELQTMPRSMERLREYLRILINDAGDDLALPPLVIANPMAKDHVTRLLDDLIALQADTVARTALDIVLSGCASTTGTFRASLVVVDDAGGGWTNRYSTDFNQRFACPPAGHRYWISGILWSSEPASEHLVREAILTATYRCVYQVEHGLPKTVRDKMRQEGWVLSHAGCSDPVLDDEDVEYTREVLTPYLDADDMRTTIECLYGDEAGRTLGFTPRGLSANAGLAVALHDAHAAFSNGIRRAINT